ncbi:MAG: MFS transporter [Devosia sp.]|uniref:MFS transporter n=1 Tax=Devosia sp. TaxID=1871048 RepID=UPI001ACD0D89|nr:MFS transporter [Devosia sp.]MBN9308852.1 MFS transporter [Devosia sp.]MBN9315831.1 MFS transporter [Devosia sp.]
MRFGIELPPQRRVYGGFFIYSFCMGSLPPRLPDIQHAMGVQEGALGFGLIGAAVGTLISLSVAGPWLERFGYRRSILTLIPLLSLFYAIASFAGGPLAFFLLLVPVGLVIGGIEIILNLEADRTEHLIGRRIMNRAHGFWSFGFFSAGIVSAAVAQTGLEVHIHLLLMVPVVILGVALLLGRFDPAPHRSGGSTDETRGFATPTLAIMILVIVTLSAMIMEGAGIDWSAIYMRDEFHVTPFLAGFAVALGAFTQAMTRFFIDPFVERYSPTVVSRVLLSILFVGALLIFFAGSDWMALLGFGLAGIGTSAIFPLAMSAAAQRTDRPAATNVASLAQTSFVAFLLGPPLLGYVAEHFGIRWSFGIGIPLVILSLIFADALGRKPIRHEVD